MPSQENPVDAEHIVRRYEQRLARERRARLEAESIAEQTLRDLYQAVQDLTRSTNLLELLGVAAVAANESTCLDDAIDLCLAAVCRFMEWPVGHAFAIDPEDPDALISLGLWRLEDGLECADFVLATVNGRFGPGEGLPGRVLESAAPAWIGDLVQDDDDTRHEAAISIGMRSAFALPIVVRQEVRAVLEFYGTDAHVPSGDFLSVMASVGDQLARVLEREEAEAQLTYQAKHDALTGLANRALLLERLQQALIRAERRGTHVEVLFLDVDDFKVVNDSLGHSAGDSVLCTIAERLRSCLRRPDLVARPGRTTVARLGGDEFAIVLEECADAGSVAGRIGEAMREPVLLEGQEVFLTSSIGGASTLVAGSDPDELLRSADAAMYVAKSRGKARFERFEPSMHAAVSARLGLTSQLRRAIEENQLRLHYQPEVDLRTGRLVGVEALVRWQHPDDGLLDPDAFIGLAEETGLIVPVGEWVLREACLQACRWDDVPTLQGVTMSVNVSGRQLIEPTFAALVADALEQARLRPSQLWLEVTESVLVEDVGEAGATVHAVADLGVGLAIDDFGTGYSSLSSLQRYPVKCLKIDKSFVGRLPDDSDAGTIVLAVIRLAHNLGLVVVAEGVETEAQLTAVTGFGCDIAQGYLYSRAVPAADIETLSLRLGV